MLRNWSPLEKVATGAIAVAALVLGGAMLWDPAAQKDDAVSAQVGVAETAKPGTKEAEDSDSTWANSPLNTMLVESLGILTRQCIAQQRDKKPGEVQDCVKVKLPVEAKRFVALVDSKDDAKNREAEAAIRARMEYLSDLCRAGKRQC